MNSAALIIILLFISANLVIFFSLSKLFRHWSSTKDQVKISIITAAKNESVNIHTFIESLRTQNYSSENFEVIIVDDNSSDDTFYKSEQLISRLKNFRLIKAVEKKFPGKKGALDIGIKNSNFPYIMITDADCQPKSNWLKSFSQKFAEGYDFLFGVAPFFTNKSFAGRIARFENLRTSILTFAAAGFALPYSAAARSFGFKKNPL